MKYRFGVFEFLILTYVGSMFPISGYAVVRFAISKIAVSVPFLIWPLWGLLGVWTFDGLGLYVIRAFSLMVLRGWSFRFSGPLGFQD